MRPQTSIAKKRDGKRLTDAEIASFIDGVTTGSWADYQITAMVMAMFTRGLDAREQRSITREMLHSGEVIDLSDIEMPIADKHSTGGVGDKTSLVIAPILACCGVAVPMISGRGLGHTGGTLDKLEAIPGYNVNLSIARLKRVMKQCGFGLIGQTKQIAPADKRLYALRDATATVPYIPLIVASIMSKKLAEDLDALVLDVKTGSGAFIRKYADSVTLARELCATGRAFKVKTTALVTDMSQPLGKFVGNAVEVYECIQILRNDHTAAMQPTLDLSIELSAEILVNCRIEKTIEAAKKRIQKTLASGAALERFKLNIALQNGDPTVCDKPEKLFVKGLVRSPVKASRDGFIASVDTFAIGRAVCDLGGGRVRAEDSVDHAVGFASEMKIGDAVRNGKDIGVVFARDRRSAEAVVQSIENAYKISDVQINKPKLVKARV